VSYSGRASPRGYGHVASLRLFVSANCSKWVVRCYGCLCSAGLRITFSLAAVLSQT